MNSESIVLISKDAFCASYLPQYGNTYWQGRTPNIDELACKGIVYNRFYTAAPSSAMSYLSMFTGKYPYQQNISSYVPLDSSYSDDTLFDKANREGYETHIMWDESWMRTAYKFSLCYGKNTKFHAMNELKQSVGPHFIHESALQRDDEKSRKTLQMIEEEIKTFADNKVFLWFHLPHVINGRVSYGSDVDLFDDVVGILRKYFSDDNIFISADHGNMNGQKGKLGYGFDVDEPAIKLPLITPVKNNSVDPDMVMCNIDLYELLFNKEIPKRELIYSDTAYYAQPKRELAIICGKYKYVYHKFTKTESLFDLEWDPHEDFNLIQDNILDVDRGLTYPSREEYFYPYWDELPAVRQKLREEKNKIWREASASQKLIGYVKVVTRPLREKIGRKKV